MTTGARRSVTVALIVGLLVVAAAGAVALVNGRLATAVAELVVLVAGVGVGLLLLRRLP
jgi:hypothetical protein